MGTSPTEANAQLDGFEIAGSQEDLQEKYENVFEGVESVELQELFGEFGDILDDAPDEIIGEIEKGNVTVLMDRAINVWKWSEKKAKQLVIFAIISMMASPALSGGREEALHDLETVSSPIVSKNLQLNLGHYKKPGDITFSKGIKLAPRLSLQGVDQSRAVQSSDSSGHVDGITINGQSGEVIYQDDSRTVFGVPGVSRYERNGDGEIAVGVIVVE